MKIALVYDAVYPYVKGGGERRCFEIAKQLAKNGHDIHLYGLQFWAGSKVYQSEGITVHGIWPAIPLYTDKGRRSIAEAIYFGLACFILLKEDFDLIDCANFPFFPLFTLRLVTWLRRKPLVATWYEVWGREYWINYLGNLGYLGYLAELFASRMADQTIAISAHTAHRLHTVLGVNGAIRVVGNGIDYPTIFRTKPSKEISDIIFVGRLLEYKHVDLLLQSIARLKRKFPDIVCTIVGDGPERKNLQRLARQLSIERNLNFMGFLSDPARVYALMKSSKVFVLPSAREGFGLVVAEANACGLPVVTVDHPENGAKDLIHEGENGYVARSDAAALANRIMLLLSNRSNRQRMKQAAIRISKTYRWGQSTAAVITAYRQLVHRE